MDPIYLDPNFYVDSDDPGIIAYAHEHSSPARSPLENAVQLYYAIRDGFRYNPFHLAARPEGFKASRVVRRTPDRGGHCIDKANLLAACARVLKIPSRLHFANVRNHIGVEKLVRHLGTDLLVFHGYAELYLQEKWVAATPAFNKELCDYLRVAPLEFDGEENSVFQQYDRAGGLFMEYVHDYGPYPDIPFDFMMKEWQHYYAEFIRRKEAGEIDLDGFFWEI